MLHPTDRTKKKVNSVCAKGIWYLTSTAPSAESGVYFNSSLSKIGLRVIITHSWCQGTFPLITYLQIHPLT